MKKMRSFVMVCAAGLALTVLPVRSASLEGLHFDDSVQLNNAELSLNGLGLRAVLWLKGYVAGLYLSEKTGTAQGVIRAAGPKRLQMKMLVTATAADFKKALLSGIHANVPQTEWPKLQGRIELFEAAIDAVGTVKKGDTITLDFVPEQGLLVQLNGHLKAQAIPGVDFFNAVLAIFVGDSPVDAKLKRGLLGRGGAD